MQPTKQVSEKKINSVKYKCFELSYNATQNIKMVKLLKSISFGV